MPLTAKGRKVLQKFKEQYGEKGEDIFWASIVSGKLPDKKLHKKGSGKIEKAKRTYKRKKGRKK